MCLLGPVLCHDLNSLQRTFHFRLFDFNQICFIALNSDIGSSVLYANTVCMINICASSKLMHPGL